MAIVHLLSNPVRAIVLSVISSSFLYGLYSILRIGRRARGMPPGRNQHGASFRNNAEAFFGRFEKARLRYLSLATNIRFQPLMDISCKLPCVQPKPGLFVDG